MPGEMEQDHEAAQSGRHGASARLQFGCNRDTWLASIRAGGDESRSPESRET